MGHTQLQSQFNFKNQVWEKIFHQQRWTGNTLSMKNTDIWCCSQLCRKRFFRARGSLLLSRTQAVSFVKKDSSFFLQCILKDTNRTCKSLGKANIIEYNNLKAFVIYSIHIPVTNGTRAECIQRRGYFSFKWFERNSRRSILQSWMCEYRETQQCWDLSRNHIPSFNGNNWTGCLSKLESVGL